MGWLKLGNPAIVSNAHYVDAKRDASADHVERVDLDLTTKSAEHTERVDLDLRDRYPTQRTTLPDASLPFLPTDVVRKSRDEPGIVWIVVDDIVYDCTDYVHEHPGGSTVIESFRGENCSWQFWRFHNKKLMQEYGRTLRIGRTTGVVNRYKERQRFVGLRRLGVDDDW